jgi:pilus assembly protein Flp/PilA
MFRSLIRGSRMLLRKEDGLTAVEYAVALALVIVVCIAAIALIGSNMQGSFTSASTGP